MLVDCQPVWITEAVDVGKSRDVVCAFMRAWKKMLTGIGKNVAGTIFIRA
jgi:hypothetical protein